MPLFAINSSHLCWFHILTTVNNVTTPSSRRIVFATSGKNRSQLLSWPIQLAPHEDSEQSQEGFLVSALSWKPCPGLSSTDSPATDWHSSQTLFSLVNFRLQIIRMFIVLNTEYRHSLSLLYNSINTHVM